MITKLGTKLETANLMTYINSLESLIQQIDPWVNSHGAWVIENEDAAVMIHPPKHCISCGEFCSGIVDPEVHGSHICNNHRADCIWLLLNRGA